MISLLASFDPVLGFDPVAVLGIIASLGSAVGIGAAAVRLARRQDIPPRFHIPPPAFDPTLVIDELIETAMERGYAEHQDVDHPWLQICRCPEREEDEQWRATFQLRYPEYFPTAQEAGAWLFCRLTAAVPSRRRAP